jgi:lysophospholipase L1-like esterase
MSARSLVKYFALALMAIILGVAAFAVFEERDARATLRPAAQRQRFPYVRAPFTRTDVTISAPVPGLAPRSIAFTTSTLGLRADELDLEAPRQGLRVLTLGGSVTECFLLDDADAWPHVLQDTLAARTHAPVWVGNAGASGQMSLDFIAHAKVLVPLLAPDITVVMLGGNDLQAWVEGRLFPAAFDTDDATRRYAERLYTGASPALRSLEPSWALARLRRDLNAEAVDPTGFYAQMKARRNAATRSDDLPDFEDALDVYAANVRQLATALRQAGTTPVFLTHPSLWRDDLPPEAQAALWAGYDCMDCPAPKYRSEKALARAMEQLNRALLDVCRTERVECLDLAPKVPKTLDSFYDDAHLLEAGSRIVANLVADFLVERMLVEVPR